MNRTAASSLALAAPAARVGVVAVVVGVGID
jgi:hypothetical protein